MGLKNRVEIYREIESYRKKPLITYCTSDRQNAAGYMASDSIPQLLQQLSSLPKKANSIDLLLVSNGGDPTVAWRIVSLIRERVKSFSVFVPQAAYSAATLVALGANEIFMHPNGNLGPTDPQLRSKGRGENTLTHFAAEDMSSFIDFAREELKITDQAELTKVFKILCNDISAVQIGTAVRSSKLSLSMGEKLLQLHSEDTQGVKAKEISERLNKKYFHHGYAVSRTEAIDIGLNISPRDEKLENLIDSAWQDIAEDMGVLTPFFPLEILHGNKECAALFEPVPIVSIPQGLPADVRQSVMQQVLSQIPAKIVPPVPYLNKHAILESIRCAAAYITNGNIYGMRDNDMNISARQVVISSRWEKQAIPRSSK